MNILIIGATSAVAQSFALLALKSSAQFYCIARSPDKLTALSERLGEALVGSACYDFTDTARAPEVITSACDALGYIDVVLFAHGLLPTQSETELDFEEAARTFMVNTLSVIALLNPLHQLLRAQTTSAKIAVITSVAGDRGRPRNFTYGAAKGGLGVYLQGLRSKYWSSSVELYNIKLGPTDTPMTVDHEKNGTFTTPERAAELITHALNRRRYDVYVPGFWRWIMLAVRLMPEWIFQRLKFLSGP